ncbi:MAG: SprB repeat-containing protein [Bacteroidota bacterium]|nr:SprB repeat-containing protein [Bacteroidota bacterium]MDP3146056.1 SprB repeat-containing protein [Bacteroidota bacterium]
MKFIKYYLFLISFFVVSVSDAQIIVKGYIDHVVPDDLDSLGNLKLNVSGGASPYTYKWTPGNTTIQDKTNAPMNYYSLRVKDNNGDSVFYNYNLGYKINWSNFNGTASTNDSLYPATTVPAQIDHPTAVSKNILRPNTQGWAEFVMMAPMQSCLLGFLDSISVVTPGYHYDYDYALHITSGNYLYAWYGGSWIYLDVVYPGDILKIGRNSSEFYIKKNGVNKHSTSTSLTSKSLMLKAFLSTSPFMRIGASFADSTSASALSVNAFVDHVIPNGIDTLGNIKLTVSGGSTPYTYKWTPDNTTSKNKTDATMNAYSFKVKSFLGDSVIYNYNLGYKTQWSNFNGMGFSNDTLMLATTVPAQQDNPTARSINKLAANTQGWVEMVIRPYGDQFLVGLLDSASVVTPGGFVDMDYCFHITYDNALYAWSPQANFVFLGYVNTGDVVTMGRNAADFYIKINGVTSHTQTITTNKALQIKALILGDILVNIGCSFDTDLSAAFVKEHADYNNPFTGSITVNPTGGVSPYQVAWNRNDGIISNSRINLSQGSYTVSITDSLGAVKEKVVNIGIKPFWNIKKNINISADSLWLNRSDSLGVMVSDNVILRNQITWHEGVINNLNHDFSIGYIGITDTNLVASSPVFGDSLMLNRIDSCYSLMRRAVNNVLPLVGSDSILNLDDNYNNIHFIRIKNGKIKILLNGSSYKDSYTYSVGDELKIGRNINGNIYVAINEKIVFANSFNLNSQFLFPVILPATPTHIKKKAVYTGGPPVNVIPLTSFPYAVLKRELDGSYYNARNNNLYFTIDGEYNSMNLDYKVYDYKRTIMSGLSISSSTLNNGDNRYLINVTSLPIGEFFVLEVINQKNEKRVLRFTKPFCPWCQ